ncbi:MAG: SH3 domain-containing protein, partial [Agathobacter sp.]|nr:SH3 domain-containing protein [Agathobacter sp.]
ESESATEPDTPLEPEEPEIVYTYRELDSTMWATATVNVRSLPSTEGKKLGVLYYGDELQVTGQCNETGWYRVIYKGQTSYVSNKYLTDEKVKEEWPEISAADIFIPELNGDSPIIVIDAGHQEFVNKDKEPNGPGSSIMKKKVSRGTKGCVSGWWEYELNLVIAMKLKTELTTRGYQVVMKRETHEINISNS